MWLTFLSWEFAIPSLDTLIEGSISCWLRGDSRVNTDWKCVLSSETLPAGSENKFPLCFEGADTGGIRLGVLIKLGPAFRGLSPLDGLMAVVLCFTRL